MISNQCHMGQIGNFFFFCFVNLKSDLKQCGLASVVERLKIMIPHLNIPRQAADIINTHYDSFICLIYIYPLIVSIIDVYFVDLSYIHFQFQLGVLNFKFMFEFLVRKLRGLRKKVKGTYKLRNEQKTNQNEWDRKVTKQIETKQNEKLQVL